MGGTLGSGAGRPVSNWFDPTIHRLLIEAGVCQRCKDSNEIHKYTTQDIEDARVFFYDRWNWDTGDPQDKAAFELLEREVTKKREHDARYLKTTSLYDNTRKTLVNWF